MQRGVDIAAVGRDQDGGERKLFLFSVKAGDLTRAESDAGVQALRPSLNEILDDYIPNRIPPHYKKLKIVICIVVGGIIQQAVHPLVTAFINRETTKGSARVEWRPHRRATIGRLLREKLPKPLHQLGNQSQWSMSQMSAMTISQVAALRAPVSKDRVGCLLLDKYTSAYGCCSSGPAISTI